MDFQTYITLAVGMICGLIGYSVHKSLSPLESGLKEIKETIKTLFDKFDTVITEKTCATHREYIEKEKERVVADLNGVGGRITRLEKAFHKASE
jgi:hypothetical protein